MKFTTKTLDVYMWDGGQERNVDYQSSEEYSFCVNNQVVGHCATEVQSHIKSHRGEAQFYPDSWFIGDTEYLKPVLDIPAFSFENYRKQGYGRAGLQQLFHLSKQKGCEGRIHLFANKEGPAFYEHCGFVGIVAEKNGYKYFDPTPENIAKLFCRKNTQVTMKKTFQTLPGTAYDEVLTQVLHQLNHKSR